MRIFAEVS